jgi:hypothetical protein
MKRVTYNGKEFVLSRIRDGKYELVDGLSGQLVTVSSDVELGPVTSHHVGVLSSIVPFTERPREFLDELRQRRRLLLEDHKKSRARDLSKAHKSSRKGKVKLTDMELLMAQFGLNGNGSKK